VTQHSSDYNENCCVDEWHISVWLQGVDDAQGGRLSQIEQELYEMEVRAANVVRRLINQYTVVL